MEESKRNTTTIKITKETRDTLVRLRLHPRETYEETITRVLHKLRTAFGGII